MPRWKPARGKKKAEAPKGGAIGCVVAIVLLLLLFIWMFWIMLGQREA